MLSVATFQEVRGLLNRVLTKLNRIPYKRLWLVLIVVLCAATLVLFTCHRRDSTARVVMLPFPNQEPKAPPQIFLTARRWFWWLRFHLLGPGKTVTVRATSIQFKEAMRSSDLALSEPEFLGTNGIQVWILNDTDLTALRRRIEETPGAVSGAGLAISTANALEASVFSGNRGAGVSWNCLPRFQRDVIDLTSNFSVTEAITNQTAAGVSATNAISILTNMAVALKIQIPKGSGFFVLQTNRSTANRTATGIMVSLTAPN